MWLRIVLLVLLSMGGWAWAKAPQLNVIDGAPSVYTVKKGDTLWDISGHFLENPWLWPELWKVNDYIKNPHLIYPGDKIYLVWVDGKPQLQLKRTILCKLEPGDRLQFAGPICPFGDNILEHRSRYVTTGYCHASSTGCSALSRAACAAPARSAAASSAGR